MAYQMSQLEYQGALERELWEVLIRTYSLPFYLY